MYTYICIWFNLIVKEQREELWEVGGDADRKNFEKLGLNIIVVWAE